MPEAVEAFQKECYRKYVIQVVYVFAVSSDITYEVKLISKEDAIQDIMRNPEGQSAFKEALEAKGVMSPAPVLP